MANVPNEEAGNNGAGGLPRNRPDWSLWANVERIRLWEAVALSCNIAPEAIGGAELRGAQAGDLSEFYKRLTAALRWSIRVWDTGYSATREAAAAPYLREVHMSSFVERVRGTTWAPTLPEGFPGAPSEVPPATTTPTDNAAGVVGSGDTPMGDQSGHGVEVRLPHAARGLLRAIKVMREQYVPGKPRPKQTAVARALDVEFGWKQQANGSPSRGALAIAPLMRPDGEDDGDSDS